MVLQSGRPSTKLSEIVGVHKLLLYHAQLKYAKREREGLGASIPGHMPRISSGPNATDIRIVPNAMDICLYPVS